MYVNHRFREILYCYKFKLGMFRIINLHLIYIISAPFGCRDMECLKDDTILHFLPSDFGMFKACGSIKSFGAFRAYCQYLCWILIFMILWWPASMFYFRKNKLIMFSIFQKEISNLIIFQGMKVQSWPHFPLLFIVI